MLTFEQMKFVVKYCVLTVVLNIGCGILVPLLMDVITNAVADDSVQAVLTSESLQSFCAWIVMFAFLCWVIWEDGKRNTAYGRFDLFSSIIFCAAMFLVYFAPVLFIDHATDIPKMLLTQYFVTCRWVNGGDYTSAVIISQVLMIALLMTVYFVSHAIYLKKHPDV